MSMKRSKQRSYGRGRQDDGYFGDESKAAEPEKSWEEYVAGKPEEAFAPYSLKARFEKGALIQHPSFGKGCVLAVQGTRAEVLFADGKKKLGHGVG
jgi:hypothetical protein